MEAPHSPNLESRLSTVEAEIPALRGAVNDAIEGIRLLSSDIQQWRRDESNARRPQYIGLATLVVAVLAVTISFGVLITTPHVQRLAEFKEEDSQEKTLINAELNRIHQAEIQWLHRKIDDYAKFGEVQEAVSNHDDWLKKLDDRTTILMASESRTDGILEMLREQLTAVDEGGSRKWVRKQNQ